MSLTADGGGYDGVTAEVAVTVADDDARGLVAAPESVTVVEDGSRIFTVRLDTEPTAPM